MASCAQYQRDIMVTIYNIVHDLPSEALGLPEPVDDIDAQDQRAARRTIEARLRHDALQCAHTRRQRSEIKRRLAPVAE